MSKYSDSTILLLQCLAKNWDNLKDVNNRKQEIQDWLNSFSDHHWSKFYFFSPGYLNQQWNDNKSKDLAIAVNDLINENLSTLQTKFNESVNQSIIPQNNKKPQRLSDVSFQKDDAGLIVFILKLTLSDNQDATFYGFNVFEQLYSNFLIPLYHNRNFQVVFLTYVVITLFMMTPFCPHILPGMLGMLLASAILMMSLYMIYKLFEFFSMPEHRVTTGEEAFYSSSKPHY